MLILFAVYICKAQIMGTESVTQVPKKQNWENGLCFVSLCDCWTLNYLVQSWQTCMSDILTLMSFQNCRYVIVLHITWCHFF